MSTNGKGSKTRPTKLNQYVSNFDEISWGKKNDIIDENQQMLMKRLEKIAEDHMQSGFNLMNIVEQLESSVINKDLLVVLENFIRDQEFNFSYATKIDMFKKYIEEHK